MSVTTRGTSQGPTAPEVRSVRDAGPVATYRISFEGPASLALPTVSALADADGVELTSSEPPTPQPERPGAVVLELTVEGTSDEVAAAVEQIGDGLPREASIRLHDG